jgi:hypothetical protein
MMPVGPGMNVLWQLASLVEEDVGHEYLGRALPVKVPVDEPEGLIGPRCCRLGASIHHPFQNWDSPVRVLKVELGSLS